MKKTENKIKKKIEKKIIAAVCCAGLLTIGTAGAAMAQSPVILAGSSRTENEASGPAGFTETSAVFSDTIKIWGTVLGVEDGSIRIDNQSGASFEGEIVLNIDDEYSKVLDAENGFPAAPEEIREGDLIYAYISPAMTMSLPPMTNAELVVCRIPADYKAPEYVNVEAMEKQQDGSWVLKASDEAVYQIPADCDIIPYLTRNMVRLEDVTNGSRCLIWSDGNNVGQKIVLFAD